MTLINNKSWGKTLSLKNLKNLDAFQAETLTRGRQRRLSRRKAGPLGGLRGVPVLAETQAARRRAAASVICRPRGGEDAEEGFPDGERTEGRQQSVEQD